MMAALTILVPFIIYDINIPNTHSKHQTQQKGTGVENSYHILTSAQTVRAAWFYHFWSPTNTHWA